MFDQMKKVMEMKQQAEKIRRQLETTETRVDEGSGIRLVISGAQQFRSVTIDEGLLDPSKKAHLEKELLKSLNAAIAKSQSLAAQEMKQLMGLGGMPGF